MLTNRTERRVLRSLSGYISRQNAACEYTARQAVQGILADERMVKMLRDEERRLLAGAGRKRKTGHLSGKVAD